MNPKATKALNFIGQGILFFIIVMMVVLTILQDIIAFLSRWALDFLQGTESDLKYWSRHSPIEIFMYTMDDYIERVFPPTLDEDFRRSSPADLDSDEDATDTVAIADHEIGDKSSEAQDTAKEPLVSPDEMDALLGDGSEK